MLEASWNLLEDVLACFGGRPGGLLEASWGVLEAGPGVLEAGPGVLEAGLGVLEARLSVLEASLEGQRSCGPDHNSRGRNRSFVRLDSNLAILWNRTAVLEAPRIDARCF